jgi:predicted dehydrogenase
MNVPLSIGIIGCGEIAEQFHLPILKRLNVYRIDWVCDRQPDRAATAARRFGVTRAFSDLNECPDVACVLIATPVGSRRSILEVAFRRRWHAFCEKPFAVSLADHQWMLDVAGQSEIVLAGGYMRRHYWSTQAATNLFGILRAGNSLRITASDCQRLKRSFHGGHWYLTDSKAGGGGFLMETGSHLIDQVLTILRASDICLERVSQQLQGSVDYETLAAGTIACPNRESIPFQFALSRLRDMWSGLAFSFDNCRMEIALAPGSPIVITSESKRTVLAAPDSSTFELLDAYASQFRTFASRVFAGDASGNPSSTGLLTTKFLSECYERCRGTQQELAH